MKKLYQIEQKKNWEKIKLTKKVRTIKYMPLAPVYFLGMSWNYTDIFSKDHKEKEMESITCYKMAIKLKQQQDNQVGLREEAQLLYHQGFKERIISPWAHTL